MPREQRAVRAAESQLHMTDAQFVSLTTQVKEVYERIDGALVETLRLNAEMIRTAQQIGLEPEVGQRLFSELSACVDTMMTSRQQMVAAHTRATAIRMRTNQAARGDGCWPWPGGGGIDGEAEMGRGHLRAA